MSREAGIQFEPGHTMYSFWFDPTQGLPRNVVEAAWEQITEAEWGEFDVAAPEDDVANGSGSYWSDRPAGLSATSTYHVVFFVQAGGSPDPSDGPPVGGCVVGPTGATLYADLQTLLSRLSATRAAYLDNLSAGAVATAASLSVVATNLVLALVRLLDIQGRLPASLVGGRMDSDAQSMTAGVARKIADHVLRRNMAEARASSDGDAVQKRSLLGMAAQAVNRTFVDKVLGIFQVWDETDTGEPWYEHGLAFDAAQQPIQGVTPE